MDGSSRCDRKSHEWSVVKAMTMPHNVEELNALRLTADDIESQTGFPTHRFWVGSLLGGVYRPSVWLQPQYWLRILGVEIMMLAFISMLSMPMGLMTLRDSAPQQNYRFLQVTAKATTLMFSSWHLYLWYRTCTLRTFMHVLDDIDQYNQLLETIIVLNDLTQANPATPVDDQTSMLSVLQTSRTSLVTALTLEMQIRRHRRLFHRNPTLWQDLDQALIALQALELQEQAQEYQQVIHQAIQISMSVQATLQQLFTD